MTRPDLVPSMSRQEAIAIAQAAALASGAAHQPFEPPEWVIEAIRVAAGAAAMSRPVASGAQDERMLAPAFCSTAGQAVVDLEI